MITTALPGSTLTPQRQAVVAEEDNDRIQFTSTVPPRPLLSTRPQSEPTIITMGVGDVGIGGPPMSAKAKKVSLQ